MRKTLPAIIAVATLAMAGACTRPSTVSSGGDVSMPSTPVNAKTLPTGSVVTVTLDQQI